MSERQAIRQFGHVLYQARRWLPWIALLLVTLSIYLAWGGWRQVQDESLRSYLFLARDQAAEGATLALLQERTRLQERLQLPDVQRALGQRRFEDAAAALSSDWRTLEELVIYQPGFDSIYENLGESGFGRASVLESVLLSDTPIARMVREQGSLRLALATAVHQEGELIGVVLAMLSANRVTAASQTIGLDTEATYLALRQGGVTLYESGNTRYAEAAERYAADVGDSGFRVVAAMAPPVGRPLGLTGLTAMLVGLGLLFLAWVVWRVLPRLARSPNDDASSPTFEQALQEWSADESSAVETSVAETAGQASAEVARMPAANDAGVDRSIFRAYDIRGVVGETLDAHAARKIGQAIGTLMHAQDLTDIVVGRDGRLSGPEMSAALIEGLRSAGRNVIDIGMVPTPVVYFATHHLRTDCGVAVTGSHNPADYNGFKIVVGGVTLAGETIVDLYRAIADRALHIAPELGGLSVQDVDEDYVSRIASDLQLNRPLKVVVDAGNGVAGSIGPRVLEAIGAEVIELYCDIDGSFPNHHPDPSEAENLESLIEMVAGTGADLGIAFDGDGDRLGVITADGENIFADRLLMLFSIDVLERNPGAVIVYDVKSTAQLPMQILRAGGSPLMWKTGHSFIKAKMRETGAELAGEMSGHFFFGERWYGFDDGIYAAARLLEILAACEETPTEVLAALPRTVSTPEIKVPAPDGDPHAFIERFLESARFDDATLSTIDGLRADWADGWGLVRASNTTPILVLRFDANDEAALRRIKAAFKQRLLAVAPGLELPF